MIRLEINKSLDRLTRQDDISDLSIPTKKLVSDAIRTGKSEEALRLLDYCFSEMKTLHDGLCSLVDDILTHLGAQDELKVYRFLRQRYKPAVQRWILQTPSALESLHRGLEFQRGHGGSCKIYEDTRKYQVICDPCGSGGQLRRTKLIHAVKGAYPWTWGKSGIPYYCVHCCVMWEILPVELRGYPIRITLIGRNAQAPCIHLYYKNPALIPAKYFRRIGQVKPSSKTFNCVAK